MAGVGRAALLTQRLSVLWPLRAFRSVRSPRHLPGQPEQLVCFVVLLPLLEVPRQSGQVPFRVEPWTISVAQGARRVLAPAEQRIDGRQVNPSQPGFRGRIQRDLEQFFGLKKASLGQLPPAGCEGLGENVRQHPSGCRVA